MAKAIKITETGTNELCERIRGGSGEIGCMQHMPETYRNQSIKVLGYVAEANKVNQMYIGTLTVQSMLDKGMTPESVFRTWNQGNDGPCFSDTNRFGIKFDSCQYVQKAMKNYKQLTLK